MTPQEDTPHTFGAFLERHRLFIWKLCNRYVDGDPAAGLDFVQEVTILLWLRFDRLRPDVHPRQEEKWINYIARDCFRSLRQGQKLSMERYDNRRHPKPATETDTPSERLSEYLVCLPPTERRVVDLYVQGFKPNEIASLMGIDPALVRRHLHQAIAHMRDYAREIENQKQQ